MERLIVSAAHYFQTLSPVEAVAVILSLAHLGLVFLGGFIVFWAMGYRFR